MDEQAKHEWNADVLESTLKKSKTRYLASTAVAVPAAIVGVAGLTIGGRGVLWGLPALLVMAICVAISIRLKTKIDYCVSQLDKIGRGEGPDGVIPRQPGS